MNIGVPGLVVGSALFLLVAIAYIAFFYFFYQLLQKSFARASGLGDLVARYPALYQPEGLARRRQSVRLGPVRYRNVASLVIAPAGLYLLVRPFFTNYQAAFIPWSEFKQVKETRLWWQRAMEMSIGDPPVATLAVLMDLYEPMRPYIEAAGGRGP